MDLELKGKKVLITGASQGIGEGLAHAFAAEGCSLHLVARSADKLDALAQAIRAEHDVAVAVQALDLTEPGAIDRLVGVCGVVDVLVNNAGAIPGGDLWEVDAERWRAGWELKVFGYIDLTRAMYRLMKANGSGVILNNIGNGGEVFDFNYIAGSTGNASLMAFTRALGGRSLDDNIRVVGVNPGPVATARIEGLLRKRAKALHGDEEGYLQLARAYPLGRPAHVAEVASLFVFLASPRSGYTSGAIFTVDGGIASRRSIT